MSRRECDITTYLSISSLRNWYCVAGWEQHLTISCRHTGHVGMKGGWEPKDATTKETFLKAQILFPQEVASSVSHFSSLLSFSAGDSSLGCRPQNLGEKSMTARVLTAPNQKGDLIHCSAKGLPTASIAAGWGSWAHFRGSWQRWKWQTVLWTVPVILNTKKEELSPFCLRGCIVPQGELRHLKG